MSAARYDVSWLDDLGLPYVAYQHSDPSQRYYNKDLANEAAAYLQFIIDFYGCLPKVRPWSVATTQCSFPSNPCLPASGHLCRSCQLRVLCLCQALSGSC